MSEKALEVCKNLNQTINKLETEVIGNSILRENSIHATTRPNKLMLKNKLKNLLRKYGIKKSQL